MKLVPYSIVIIAVFQTASHGRQARDWNLVVNSEGATILTCPSVVDTPSGPHPGVLVLTKSRGGKNADFSLDFKVAEVSTVKEFHFDDFEGPESKINKKLMSLECISPDGKHESYSFLPNGGYVSDPSDGFVFGTMERGRKNQFVGLMLRASSSGGKLVIRVSDSVDPARQLTSSFDLNSNTAKLSRFFEAD